MHIQGASNIKLQRRWCLLPFKTSLLYSLWKRVLFLPNWSIKGLKVGHRGGASMCKVLFWNSKYNCHWQLQIKKQLNHTFLTVSAKLCRVYCLLFRILFKDFITFVFRQISLWKKNNSCPSNTVEWCFIQQPRSYGARESGTGRREPWERGCSSKSLEIWKFFNLSLHLSFTHCGAHFFFVFEPI